MMNTKSRETINGATQAPLTPEEKMSLSGRGGAGRVGQTETIIQNLRTENPNLTYREAYDIVKRSGSSPDVLNIRREALALSAAKADMEYFTKPDETIEKYRRKYGVVAVPPSAAAAPAGAAPAAASKPDIKQNGHLFRFNPATSKYEDVGPAP
jgi:hypothetical protein